ncbi:MAG TPA: hypothetical protein VGQ89_04630 [Candidatus Limnocylindrales bacterium]|jgi:hypothetical protein|nr:hypothetical protein [Candidatus Limnocylindrales bacterium]
MSNGREFAVAIAWLAAVAGAMLVFVVRPEHSFTGSGATLVLAGLVLAIASDASVGAILILRRPGNVVGLVLMLAATLSAATLLGWVSGAALSEQRGGHDFLAGAVSLIGGIGFVPSLFVGGPLLALLFPDGRLPGPRWRWPVGAIVAAIAVSSAMGVFHPGQIPETVTVNPFGASAFSGSEGFWTIGLALFYASVPVADLIAVVAVIVRVRRSGDIERAQLKWFVAAMVAVGTLLMLGFADGGLDIGLAAGISPTIFDLLAVASLSLPAIAVGVAILRYHLFEIDRIISRTLSWALMTGLLGAVFVGLVVGLQALSANVTSGNTLAVAASTLVVAALFQPLRRRVQGAVDRRFNRARYDAEQTAAAFAERQRDQVSLTGLKVDIAGTIDSALRPTAIGVWIRSSGRGGTP